MTTIWTLSAMPGAAAFGGEESVEGLSIGRQARLPVLWQAAGATGRKPRRHEGGRLVGDCKGNDHPFGASGEPLPSGSSSRCVSGVIWELGDDRVILGGSLAGNVPSSSKSSSLSRASSSVSAFGAFDIRCLHKVFSSQLQR